jgi:hypothetical protein
MRGVATVFSRVTKVIEDGKGIGDRSEGSSGGTGYQRGVSQSNGKGYQHRSKKINSYFHRLRLKIPLIGDKVSNLFSKGQILMEEM